MAAALVQRITAALDGAEKLAEAAIQEMRVGYYFGGDTRRESWASGVAGGLGGPVGDHAACWPPDRVLALIAADRRACSGDTPPTARSAATRGPATTCWTSPPAGA
jgi:hypothetical protein